MSSIHVGRVWRDSGATGNARLLLLALAETVTPEGEVAPGSAWIQWMTKLDYHTEVLPALDELITLGEVVKYEEEGAPPTYHLSLGDEDIYFDEPPPET